MAALAELCDAMVEAEQEVSLTPDRRNDLHDSLYDLMGWLGAGPLMIKTDAER